jgi:hypothetical protein
VNPGPSLQLGIVVAVYPAGQSVDVLLPDSGSQLTNVQVMLPSGSDSTGTVDLPDPGLPADDTRWNITNNAARNILAVIASYKGNPLCLGFIMPQIGQMTFAQKNRRIVRHASDVYSTVDQFGNIEVYHPSGTFWRVGTSPAHEDLTGLDVDQQWAIKNNTGTAPYLNLTLANAGAVKAQIQIDPDGNVTLTAPSLTVTAANGITMNGATIDANGNMGVPGTATIEGALATNSTLTAAGLTTGGGVNLDTHTHSGVEAGSDNTGPPA